MGVELDPFDDDIFASVAANNNVRAGGRFQPRGGKRGPVSKQPAAVSCSSSKSHLENQSNIAVENDKSSKPNGDKCLELLNWQNSGLEKSEGENEAISCPPSTTGIRDPKLLQGEEDSNLQNNHVVASTTACADNSGRNSCTANMMVELEEQKNKHALDEDNGTGKVKENEEQLEEDFLTGYPESPLGEDPLTGGHPIVSVSEGSSLMHDERLKRKQVDLDPCLESLDISDVTSYGPRTGKFQPKPKIHIHEDDVLDLSSLGFDHSVPPELTSQLPAHEMSQAEPAPHEGDTYAVCDMHERMGTREASTNERTASTSKQRSRPLRKCNKDRQSVDESIDEEPNELSADSSEHLMDHNADKESQVDNKFQEKKLRKGSKKPVVDKEKPVRKRKKAGEVTNQATGPSKKFSHSTRQKKRKVDQVLLETPEDEIESQKVPLRDLLILAEYKERMTKKSATASQVPLTDTSSTHNNEDEEIPSEQAEIPEVLFNYQTFMKKTPISRWSKQDTELFYQAVQQFGTDLSMIQQLFPGRTRKQVKLKYKKEERQQPLRLREALTNRPNDYSHFHHVIEHLQKVAAENQETGSKDESIDMDDCEETEQMPETIDGEAKSEQQLDQEEAYDLAAEVPIKSPPISYESEEDFEFDFSQYKSEV